MRQFKDFSLLFNADKFFQRCVLWQLKQSFDLKRCFVGLSLVLKLYFAGCLREAATGDVL